MRIDCNPLLAGVAFALVLGTTSALAHDEHAPPAFAGAWKGTIGTAPVMACFTIHGEATYYYLRHRRGILLRPRGDETRHGGDEAVEKALRTGKLELDERAPAPELKTTLTGRWSLAPAKDGSLAGQWTDPSGGKRLPIALTRATSPAGPSRSMPESGCPEAFHAPIRAAVKPVRKEDAFQGKAYGRLSTPDAEAFSPAPSLPHAAALERIARTWLEDQAVFAFDCTRGRGTPEPLGRTLLPIEWNARFIVLQDSLPETYCGGAHGFYDTSYVTWSLEAGRKVDTWSWIAGGQGAVATVPQKDGSSRPTPLFAALVKAHPRNVKDDECAEFIGQMTVDSPIGTAKGLVFPNSFGHAIRVCGEDIVVPWATVAPFLSPAGRDAASAWAAGGPKASAR